jgi:hypothetical protein
MVLYGLKLWVVDETCRSRNTCHERDKHQRMNNQRTSGRMANEVHRVTSLDSRGEMLPEIKWTFLGVLSMKCLACEGVQHRPESSSIALHCIAFS